MTTKAMIKQAELLRMAKVAKKEGVTIWIELDGYRIGVSPELPSVYRQQEPDEDEDEITL